MTLASVHPGDLVEVDIRGTRFIAKVTAKDRQGLAIEPIGRAYTWRRASAQQVVEHWRKRRARKPAAATAVVS